MMEDPKKRVGTWHCQYIMTDELKKEKAKYLIKTYVELKSILTEEQKQSLKAIWRICAKGQGPKAGE